MGYNSLRDSFNVDSDLIHKETIYKRIHLSIKKLNFLYEIQGKRFWYMNVAQLDKDDLQQVNDEFVKVFGDNFYDLGLNLGSSFQTEDLTIELYKFNETLTRLLSHQSSLASTSGLFRVATNTTSNHLDSRTTSEESLSLKSNNKELIDQIDNKYSDRIDSTLMIKTVLKLIILKLRKLTELIKSNNGDHNNNNTNNTVKFSNIELKLIDDVLIKNLSHRILEPYHNLLINRVKTQFTSIC